MSYKIWWIWIKRKFHFFSVESDRTQFASDWDLKEITAWKILPSNDHELLQVYFPFNTWLEKKGSTIKAKGETHSSTDHRARGN